MKDDKETKEKLIDSAKKEFLEKGYNKASLRKICADAGVTTGALYFFFKDKEDLFDSIVRKPYEELGIMIQEAPPLTYTQPPFKTERHKLSELWRISSRGRIGVRRNNLPTKKEQAKACSLNFYHSNTQTTPKRKIYIKQKTRKPS